ncbi:hypothetical protein [Ferdinandcohnia sp. SAFN-114]
MKYIFVQLTEYESSIAKDRFFLIQVTKQISGRRMMKVIVKSGY